MENLKIWNLPKIAFLKRNHFFKRNQSLLFIVFQPLAIPSLLCFFSLMLICFAVIPSMFIAFPKFLLLINFVLQSFSFSKFTGTQDFSYALYGCYPHVHLQPIALSRTADQCLLCSLGIATSLSHYTLISTNMFMTELILHSPGTTLPCPT